MPKELWTIRFETPDGDESQGVIIFDATHLYGGDGSFYYQGTYTTNAKDGTLTGQVDVVRHDPSAEFIFPSLNVGRFQITGQLTKPDTLLKAHLIQYPQHTLAITCHYVKDLA
jgi:hypothetical protein